MTAEQTTTHEDAIRLWLDDDLVDRAAPDGWTHVTTAQEAIDLLDGGRVVELSLDHDLGEDDLHGTGMTVVNYLAEQQFLYDRLLWPRDGLTIHSANASGRDAMLQVAESYASKVMKVRRAWTAGGKPKLTFSPR